MIRELIRSIAGYPGLFLFCVISGLVIPLPEDFSLLFAGMRIAEGRFTWLPTCLVAIAGVFVRDVGSWGLGRLLGPPVLQWRWVKFLFGEPKLERAQAMVRDHGGRAVLIGRTLVGFRAPVFVVSGALGVPLRTFAMYDLVGLVVIVPFTVALGFYFGQPVVDVMFYGLQRARAVVALAVFITIAWMAWSRTRR